MKTGAKSIDGQDILVGNIVEGFFENNFGSLQKGKGEIFFCKKMKRYETKMIGVSEDDSDMPHWSIDEGKFKIIKQ